jgi:hypothetical protein
VAEKAAGVSKLGGSLWHAYRRKWVTERSPHYSIKQIADRGGWVDYDTILTCYDQPNDEAIRAVMDEPRKLTERGIVIPSLGETGTLMELAGQQ